ncbi:MAG: PepSY-associated TM helix domain-containing protein [Nevskia sp.]|nr:PepSY-associated TM helix domain-containing protein [Nevskia sp.]
MTPLRSIARQVHLYAGLAAAPFLLVIGATGAFLEFEYPIDRWLNPGLSQVSPGPSRVPLQVLLQEVRAAFPEYEVQSLDLSPYSPAPELSYAAQVMAGKDGPAATVYIDQYSGRILGMRQGSGFAASVHEFHTNLLLGDGGEAAVMLVSTLLVLLGASGLVLWWPRKLVRVDWTGSSQRLNFTLHHALGIFCSLSLLVFGATGFVVYWQGNWLLPAANRALRIVDEEPVLKGAVAPAGAIAVSLDQADAQARREVPGARTTRISLPAPGGAYKVWMKYPEDQTPLGRTNLLIDPYSGKVLWCRTSRSAAVTTRYFRQWNREIHTGELLGWPTRLLACLTALLLPGLAVSGPLIWWKRRRRPALRTGNVSGSKHP